MGTADAVEPRSVLTDRAGATIALLTAALLAFPTLWIAGEGDGVRSGTLMALAVAFVAACFGRAAYKGTLPRPFNGSPVLFLMALLALLTGLSVGWSLLPGVSYFDAVRLVGYTAVMAGGALAAQSLRGRAREVAAGVALAALAISVYALLSRVVPGIYPSTDTFGRIRLPFYYWNAVGGVAAIAFVATMWAGVQRGADRVLELASYPAGGVAFVTLMLTQSRGALLALIVTVLVWLFFVPRRLRTVGWLGIVLAISGLVVAWAYSRPALSTDGVELATRKSTGAVFGVILLVMIALLVGFGWLIHSRRTRQALAPPQRVKVGRAVAIAAAVFAVIGFIGVGVGNDRGFSMYSDELEELFGGSLGAPTNSPGRLADANSLRSLYWRDARDVFNNHKLHGTGSDTFSVSRLPFRDDTTEVQHAHGYIPQVMADLGLLGLGTVLLLFAAWGFYALRLLGMRRAAPWDWLGDVDDQRLAEISLLSVVVAFGVQSAIDWTWFIPGIAIFGLATAGWIAGTPSAHKDSAVEFAGGGQNMRIARAVSIGLLGLLMAFAVYQPVRAKQDVTEGLSVADNDPARALELGQHANEIDPASAEPMFLIAIAQNNLGDEDAAEETLVRIAIEQPGNLDTWQRLAQYRLNTLDDPKGAIAALKPLLYQSPNSTLGNSLLNTARERRTEQLIDEAAERERRRIQRELDKIEKLLDGTGSPQA